MPVEPSSEFEEVFPYPAQSSYPAMIEAIATNLGDQSSEPEETIEEFE